MLIENSLIFLYLAFSWWKWWKFIEIFNWMCHRKMNNYFIHFRLCASIAFSLKVTWFPTSTIALAKRSSIQMMSNVLKTLSLYEFIIINILEMVHSFSYIVIWCHNVKNYWTLEIFQFITIYPQSRKIPEFSLTILYPLKPSC